MGIPNPSVAPEKVARGDTLKFKISDGEFPASDGWTYKFIITASGKLEGPISSTADGDDHQVTVEEGVTALWGIGDYTYVGYFEHSGGDRWTAHRGRFEVGIDPATTNSVDLRTHAQIALDAIEAVLESRATLDQQKYQIGGRSLDRMLAEDLLDFRDYYRNEVARELRKSTGPGSDKNRSARIRPRFPG